MRPGLLLVPLKLTPSPMRALREGLYVRSTFRFNARSTPMRACIRKSRPSAAPDQALDGGLPFL
jgi:hypothetical protein